MLFRSEWVTRVLEGGALGVIVPHVRSAAEAAQVVAHARYAPAGERSYAGGAPQLQFGSFPSVEAMAAINDATSGRGVDLILDLVGADYFARNIASLAVNGRLVEIGFMGGQSSASIDLADLLRRRLTVTGSTLRARGVEEKGAIAAALRREVWPLLESGRVTPVIYRTFPLADAAAAHRLMESGAHVGKIVLATEPV